MNSKECLEKLKEMPTCSECELYGKCFERPLCNELYNTIKQDLDRVEMLEKALDKACELLADYTGICPFSKKLMYETNCDLNCKDTYKECWKKYFMKEVLGNKWYNKPLPAFAPEENYDYSFVNDCLQKAEKYDCERLEKENQELRNSIKSWDETAGNLLKENRKLKEVIKIIITKGVNELFLKNTKTSDDYNKIIKQLEYFDELTQEEYELLKEVL